MGLSLTNKENVDIIKVKRALISVSDKTGLVDFAKRLLRWEIEIISTGGTLKTLQDAGIAAKSVSEITSFPEILDGRVKTLHPKIHAGLLAITDNELHQQQLAEFDIEPIDLIVVNLYPFEKTVAKQDVELEEAIEQIDIGGPAMLRSAAKNFKYKTVVSNPVRYNLIVEELEKNDGAISYSTRFALAKEVFQHTARYDTVVVKYLSSVGENQTVLPETFSVILRKVDELRYGENPHQKAALYGDFFNYFEKLHGKELSFNNIVDIQAAAELIAEFDAPRLPRERGLRGEPTATIIKHTNPCGVGSDEKLVEAYRKSFTTDQKSAFGGIVALNRPIDMETAKLINEIFIEVLVAPEFPREVLEFLRKKKDRRLIRHIKPVDDEINLKKIAGGLLVQETDNARVTAGQLQVVTKRSPTQEEVAAMLYGWRVVKHLKSNAIVFARSDRTIGIGAGQMSRVDSARIAVLKAKKAKLDLKGTIMASDAFFPFADSVKEAIKVGITAIIQPGGSIRDAEVIEAADKANIAMVFTGIRHFKH
ncbi:MAG: bifunctional phosphoribosylaminoimidazolecarboxamide formyltransferase/IMP cyclohydrolase [Bacteroidetes bacterium]|nr:bifunctional phosphoribosylaminoimidazolecarboxamide formyltransferase/IMP cyclohydrolase [Bacteroidota bacterium]